MARNEQNEQEEYSGRQEIEFLGGPLDGHIEPFLLPIPTFVYFRSEAELKHVPWFARLAQLLSGKFSEPFLVATYALELANEQLFFRHMASSVATEQKFNTGRVWLLADGIELGRDII